MEQLPHDIGREEMSEVIYDTLMNNTGKKLADFTLEMQEVDKEKGFIYFDIDTEKGTKRVHIQIEVEDIIDDES